MSQFPVFLGVFRYEFLMQVRRRAVWITMFLFAALIVLILMRSTFVIDRLAHLVISFPLITVLVQWTASVNRLLPLGVGVLLADRLIRDRKIRVDELLTTTPGALSVRLAAKYLGSMLATLLPMFVFYVLGVAFITYQTHNLAAIPLSLVTFAAIALPGVVFVSAFSVACPAVLWVPLYQFLFVGYWFWGNLLGPHTGIPTISETVLSPVGHYMTDGFFGVQTSEVTATPLQAVESVLALVGLAIFVQCVLWAYLKWQQARQ